MAKVPSEMLGSNQVLQSMLDNKSIVQCIILIMQINILAIQYKDRTNECKNHIYVVKEVIDGPMNILSLK